MEIAQEREWAEAQEILLSMDMVPAAKCHLQFLAAVDQIGHLYEGPALERAVYRYKACWLPLLAKHSRAPIFGVLVIPLDCEWIWHCHRLNPLRYISDCKVLFGRLLDNRYVVSSIEGHSKNLTEKIWSKLYPQEPYELDFAKVLSDDALLKSLHGKMFTNYDLFSAVERQRSFNYQVSRPHMGDDLFLKESVARYKAFLYLIKRNMMKPATHCCVPTYDISFIWHTHQLHPYSYCKDLIHSLGMVVEHDDTDSDRSADKKVDIGFRTTTQQWEEVFGKRYWRAGAMYRETIPDPPKPNPASDKCLMPTEAKVVEVLFQFVGAKNIPEGLKKGNLFVSLKKQSDKFFGNEMNLSILSISGEKEAAVFWCEPTGDLLFDLKYQTISSTTKASRVLGCGSLCLNEFLDPITKLSVERLIELAPPSPYAADTKPILVHVAASFSVPVPVTPQVIRMLHNEAYFSKGKAGGVSCCVKHAGAGAGAGGKYKGVAAVGGHRSPNMGRVAWKSGKRELATGAGCAVTVFGNDGARRPGPCVFKGHHGRG